MVNYRVADVHTLVRELRAEGCNMLDKVEGIQILGKFGWVHRSGRATRSSSGNRRPANRGVRMDFGMARPGCREEDDAVRAG